MDEPLGALSMRQLREQMQYENRYIHENLELLWSMLPRPIRYSDDVQLDRRV